MSFPPSLSVIDFPPYVISDGGDDDGGLDRKRLNDMVVALQGDIFISTLYTRCTAVKNVMLVHDMIPYVLQWEKSQDMDIRDLVRERSHRGVSHHSLIKDFYIYISRTSLSRQLTVSLLLVNLLSWIFLNMFLSEEDLI